MSPSRVIGIILEDRKGEDSLTNTWCIGKVFLDKFEIVVVETETPNIMVIQLPLLQDGNDLVEKLPIFQLPQN